MRRSKPLPSKAVTFGDVVREYFPNVSNEKIEFILWAETGFPCFWNIPADGNTPEECLRKQLEDYRKEIKYAQEGTSAQTLYASGAKEEAS